MSHPLTRLSTYHPARAVAFASGKKSAYNWVPALLWLWLAVVGLLVIRRRGLPTQGEIVTVGAGAGGVVLIGSFAPVIVFWGLVALLVAAALNTPGLGGFIGGLQTRLADLNAPNTPKVG